MKLSLLYESVLTEATWFGHDKPQKFYHRTNKMFDRFKSKGDDGYIKKHATDNGIYFTSSPNIKAYGNILYTVFIKIDNPLYVRHHGSENINPYTGKRINMEHVTDYDLKWLYENGYDAIISQMTGQVVVFRPEQIKILSVTED